MVSVEPSQLLLEWLALLEHQQLLVLPHQNPLPMSASSIEVLHQLGWFDVQLEEVLVRLGHKFLVLVKGLGRERSPRDVLG